MRNQRETFTQDPPVTSWLLPTGMVIMLISVWEAIVRILQVPNYLVPAPTKILATLWDNKSVLAIDTATTFLEALIGFLVANLAALLFAVLFYYSRLAERTLLPLMVALKSVPIVAIAPLLVLWFGYGLTSKVVMAALVAFFPLVIGVITGIRTVPASSIDLMRSLSATRFETFYKLSIPHSVPHILAALKISSTLAVVGAIVAELTGSRRGLGFTILMSSYNVDTPMLFAAIALSSLVGGCLFILVLLVERFSYPYLRNSATPYR